MLLFGLPTQRESGVKPMQYDEKRVHRHEYTRLVQDRGVRSKHDSLNFCHCWILNTTVVPVIFSNRGFFDTNRRGLFKAFLCGKHYLDGIECFLVFSIVKTVLAAATAVSSVELVIF